MRPAGFRRAYAQCLVEKGARYAVTVTNKTHVVGYCETPTAVRETGLRRMLRDVAGADVATVCASRSASERDTCLDSIIHEASGTDARVDEGGTLPRGRRGVLLTLAADDDMAELARLAAGMEEVVVPRPPTRIDLLDGDANKMRIHYSLCQGNPMSALTSFAIDETMCDDEGVRWHIVVGGTAVLDLTAIALTMPPGEAHAARMPRCRVGPAGFVLWDMMHAPLPLAAFKYHDVELVATVWRDVPPPHVTVAGFTLDSSHAMLGALATRMQMWANLRAYSGLASFMYDMYGSTDVSRKYDAHDAMCIAADNETISVNSAKLSDCRVSGIDAKLTFSRAATAAAVRDAAGARAVAIDDSTVALVFPATGITSMSLRGVPRTWYHDVTGVYITAIYGTSTSWRNGRTLAAMFPDASAFSCACAATISSSDVPAPVAGSSDVLGSSAVPVVSMTAAPPETETETDTDSTMT